MTFRALVRSNWHLTLAMVLFAAAGIYGLRGDTGVEASNNGPVQQSAESMSQTTESKVPVRASESERATRFIGEYEAKLKEDPKSPEAPALLSAMGNLYRQKLGDYERAAQCYERLLYDYPKWEGSRKAYIQLVACYETLGNEDSLRNTYKRMMEEFPPDSQEYLYAKTQLGL